MSNINLESFSDSSAKVPGGVIPIAAGSLELRELTELTELTKLAELTEAGLAELLDKEMAEAVDSITKDALDDEFIITGTGALELVAVAAREAALATTPVAELLAEPAMDSPCAITTASTLDDIADEAFVEPGASCALTSPEMQKKFPSTAR